MCKCNINKKPTVFNPADFGYQGQANIGVLSTNRMSNAKDGGFGWSVDTGDITIGDLFDFSNDTTTTWYIETSEDTTINNGETATNYTPVIILVILILFASGAGAFYYLRNK